MRLTELWDRIVSTLYPPRCVMCGAVVEYGDLSCGRCTAPPQPQPVALQGGVLHMYVPYVYDGGPRNAVLRLKSEADRRIARFFSQSISILLDKPGAEVTVPVPISPVKLAARGFNQALLLAEELARLLEIPCVPDALRQLDGSEIQHTLTAREREENARRAFVAGDSIQHVGGKRVLLVDDVYTTGATMAACAARLLEAGAVSVSGAAATCTVKKEIS